LIIQWIAAPTKQGLFLNSYSILHPDKIRETKPDYLLICSWNLKEEIMAQMAFILEWGGKCQVPTGSASENSFELTMPKVISGSLERSRGSKEDGEIKSR